MTLTQENAPAGLQPTEASMNEATSNSTSGSESTSMDTLYNLENMVVDGVLGTGRLLTRDELTDADVERFESRVDRSAGPDACHLWTAARTTDGYGHMWVGGRRKVRAHRVAYVLAYGVTPAGLVVRHRCDNPPCCNPAHLTLGSIRDNVHDTVERGRHVPCPGESHGRAKLTEADVNAMRRRARAGAKYVDLAAEYGVSDAVARDAVTGRKWKSASEPPVVEVRCQKRPWTPAEDAVVLATLDDPVKVVAARLGRTVSSVANRRAVLRRRQAVAA